jgi:hypothetical protein
VTGPGEALPDAYAAALATAGGATLRALETIEIAQRRLHPATVETLRALLQPVHERLEIALAEFRDAEAPIGLQAFHARLVEGAEACLVALHGFVEPACYDRLDDLDPEPPAGVSVGFHRAGPEEDADGRGGFSLCVPERYDARSAWPLVVALHGGSGRGRDFLWTWLREARWRPSRECCTR